MIRRIQQYKATPEGKRVLDLIAVACASTAITGGLASYVISKQDKQVKKLYNLSKLYHRNIVRILETMTDEQIAEIGTDLQFDFLTHDLDIKE